MFHVHGIQGHVFSGTLEQLRERRAVAAVARAGRVAPAAGHADRPAPAAPDGHGHGIGHQAVLAYGGHDASGKRQPLRCVADVMRSPALTVPAAATQGEAWQLLARHGIGQAPVLDGHGVLVGLVGRAGLMPPALAAAPAAATEQARLARPVAELMWTPVPSAAPDTDLRRVAALLLDTGLPGVPVADASGRVVGFVSRTDLLRALATDPPLDLWG
jgi:CBS domain-containing protein